MKFDLPEIAWHGTQPIYCCDFQRLSNDSDLRMATGGADNEVKLWKVWVYEDKVKIEVMSILSEHKRSVNCVKFSPVLAQGLPVLASCDDDGVVCLWTKCDEKEKYAASFMDDDSDLNKEYWKVSRTLRGHIEEIQDLCWNTDGSLLLSGSIDTSARLWNTATGQCLHAFRESKGLIQGVAIDPLGKFIATFADDKSVRIYHATNKRCAFKNTKFSYNDKLIKLFGDTGDGFFHRICFSPNGEFFMVPSGSYQLSAESSIFCTYVYCRDALNKPVLYLPCGKRPSVAVAFCPLKFKLRRSTSEGESSSVGTVFNLQYRLIFTVITEQTLLFYDTEKLDPFAKIENIHYASLNSGSWNNDGTLFVATSSDGYATICNFEAGELGEIMPDSDVVFQTVQTPQNTPLTASQETEKEEDMEVQSSVLQEVQNEKAEADSETEKPKKESSKSDHSNNLGADDKKLEPKKNIDEVLEAKKSEEQCRVDEKDVSCKQFHGKDEDEEITCLDEANTPKTKSEPKSKSASKLTNFMAPQNAMQAPRMSLGSTFLKKQADKERKDKKKEIAKDSKKTTDANVKRNQILSSFARGNRILAESLRQQKENAEKNGEDALDNKENNGNAKLKPITIDDDSNSTPDIVTTPKPLKEKQMETPPRNTSAPTTPKSILKTPSPDSPLVASGKKRRVSFKNVDVSNKEATSGKDEKLESVQDVEMEELPPVDKAAETSSSVAPSKKRKIPFVTLA